MDEPLGIYVHIPFCGSKCYYCDFVSFDDASDRMDDYARALIGEIRRANINNRQIDTIFFGGGTPTVLPPSSLSQILEEIYKLGGVLPNAEITIESNPGMDIGELKNIGFNRLSFGLQAAQDRLLKVIGRRHTFAQFCDNYKKAREIGFDNVNVDLMFSLPGQTLADWEETVETVAALGPEHISAYSLTIAEDTPFGRNTPGNLPDDETDRKMYWNGVEILGKYGYNRYEISNLAKPEKECKHNVNCWRRREYIGFGLAAHSFYGGRRWSNTKNLDDYIGSFLGEKDALAERMFLGLRLTEGVKYDEIPNIYTNVIKKHMSDGLLEIKGGRVRLTKKGADLSNIVFRDFIL